jgi:hypothetical protein
VAPPQNASTGCETGSARAIAILSMIQDSVLLMQQRRKGGDMEIPLHEVHQSMQVLRQILRDVEEGAQK